MKTSRMVLATLLLAHLGGCDADYIDDGAAGEPVVAQTAAISADERLDTSFGGDGRMTQYAGHDVEVMASALRSDGRTLHALTHWIDSTPQPPLYLSFRMLSSWLVARTANNGTVDASWNGGAAFDMHSATGAFRSYGGDVLPIAGNKTFAVGTIYKDNHTRGVVARLDNLGHLDTSFDGDGYKVYPPPAGFTTTSWTWIRPDHAGHYMLGGVAWKNGEVGAAGATPYFLIARINPNGAIDTGYDHDGYYTHALGTDPGKLFFTIGEFVDDPIFVASQGDGRVYGVYPGNGGVAITPWANGVGYTTVPSFGNWRPTITGLTNNGYEIFASVTPAMGMIQIDPGTGHIEGTLEYGGAWTVPGMTDTQARAITFNPVTQRLLLVGDGKDSAGKRRAIVLDVNGGRRRDRSFHEDGIAITSFGNELGDGINAVSVAANEGKFVTTVTDYRNGFGAARYNVAIGGFNEPCHFNGWNTVAPDCNGDLECSGSWNTCKWPPAPQPVPDPTPTPDPGPGPMTPMPQCSVDADCGNATYYQCSGGQCQARSTSGNDCNELSEGCCDWCATPSNCPNGSPTNRFYCQDGLACSNTQFYGGVCTY